MPDLHNTALIYIRLVTPHCGKYILSFLAGRPNICNILSPLKVRILAELITEAAGGYIVVKKM